MSEVNNTATSVGFAVIYRGSQPTNGQLVYALASRLADLLGDDASEIPNALWDPWDTVTEDEGDLWVNGVDITPELSAWDMRTLARTIRQITQRRRSAA